MAILGRRIETEENLLGIQQRKEETQRNNM